MARPSLNQIDEIRQEMARLRLGLHQDASSVVGEATHAFDWKARLTQYPWVTVGLAIVVGYLVVPKKRLTAGTLAPMLHEAQQTVATSYEPPRREPKKAGSGSALWSLAKFAFSIGGPIALQAVQSYAVAWLEDSLANPQRRDAPPGTPPSTKRPVAAQAPRRG